MSFHIICVNKTRFLILRKKYLYLKLIYIQFEIMRSKCAFNQSAKLWLNFPQIEFKISSLELSFFFKNKF